jgi:hypothetical protein
MRLLHVEKSGDLSLAEFYGKNIPAYAILSHRWGPPADEVTFLDLMTGSSWKKKPGYRKIWFCQQEAEKDNLKYFWVDSCCIDRQSSAELSESINSMFRWYKDARRCYVYLQDVEFSTWADSFRNSQWFTRGWTLQELIAPTYVEFFSAEWIGLGTKDNLVDLINQITHVDVSALLGEPLSSFSIEHRFLWQVGRETTREEDMAYCMLGILDVHISAIYGEGKDHAFMRLEQELSKIDRSRQELLSFLSSAVSKGATYLGHKTPILEEQLRQLRNENTYILTFSRVFVKDQVWSGAQNLFSELLNQKKSSVKFAILDCDAISTPLEKPLISHYKYGQEMVHNLLDRGRFNDENCVAKYNKDLLRAEMVEPPAHRSFVKIPCPGEHCSEDESYEWKCQRCMNPLEFGFVDEHIYCQCGKSGLFNYQFKCQQNSHGANFARYELDKLRRLLKLLDSPNDINILILGETGVGKATFINAFVNYLEFESLDNAMVADPLRYAVPTSFSFQIMDRENPEERIKELKIKVESKSQETGSNKEESVAREPFVYPVIFQNEKGYHTVRLIDTPSMGDNRGVEYDKKNMADVLMTIKSFAELHGILVLLKPNTAQITTAVLSYVTDLLVHLHPSATSNLVFGFTNSRISNYTPGDTFTPLKDFLTRSADIGLSLSTKMTYCFDSESFRYLAAFKNGVHLPNKEGFEQSWGHSREETMRLLDYLQSIKPHDVKNHLTYHSVRELVISLTKPMAEISQSIKRNIEVVSDEIVGMKTFKSNASSRKMRWEEAIQLKQIAVQEYDEELQQIRVTAAKLNLFIKTRSITPYNDPIKSYLDFLIKEERKKVLSVTGASRKRLESLEDDLTAYEMVVTIVEASIYHDKHTPFLSLQAVDQLIQELYGLKNFGKNLKILQSALAKAHEATKERHPIMLNNS